MTPANGACNTPAGWKARAARRWCAQDFNNILAVIASYSDCCWKPRHAGGQRRGTGRRPQRQSADQPGRGTRHQLTKQLLALGRRDITQAEVLNLNHVIDDVEQMLRRTLGGTST